MPTAEKNPEVSNTDSSAIKKKTSTSKSKSNSAGRPVGYTPLLPFSSGKLCKGLAEQAFKEFVKVNELCESQKATSDDLKDLLVRQSVAGLEIRKAASIVWLTQGMLLENLFLKVKSEKQNWQAYFREHLEKPLDLSIRSSEHQRKMYRDWKVATSKDPEGTQRSLEECEQVNQLAGHLKKHAKGEDPFAMALPSEKPTMVADESSKKRQAKLKQVQKLADELGDLGYPADVVQLANELHAAMSASTIDSSVVTATENETIDVDVTVTEDPEKALEDAIGDHLEAAAAPTVAA